MDSRDIGPIRLDPNVCPEGCDPDIYNKTYDLRNTRYNRFHCFLFQLFVWNYLDNVLKYRHKHEQEMMEQDRLVELLRKDIDAHNKIKRKLSLQLEKRKNDLREFMVSFFCYFGFQALSLTKCRKHICLCSYNAIILMHSDGKAKLHERRGPSSGSPIRPDTSISSTRLHRAPRAFKYRGVPGADASSSAASCARTAGRDKAAEAAAEVC